MSDERKCKCGEPVTRQEIRIVERCSNGHFVGSKVQSAVVSSAPLIEPIRPGQIAAVHAMTGRLDKVRDLPPDTTHDQVLKEHGVGSTKDLDATKASVILDGLRACLRAEDPDYLDRR